MKILIVLTGGTIGSTETNNIIHTDNKNFTILQKYREIYGTDIDFDTIQLFNILSENIDLSVWSKLVNYLYTLDYSKYNGIILTHGSDTFSYTSSLLGIALRHIPIPFVMVCSNFIPSDERSNALQNFSAAVTLIKDAPGLKGVFSAYSNDKTICSIFLSTRILEADQYTDRFLPFGQHPFALCKDNQLSFVDYKENPDLAQINNGRMPLFNTPISLSNRVLIIYPYPGIYYKNFNLDENTKAVLHATYHSGTAYTERNGLPDFIHMCAKRNIPVYMASLKNEKNIYKTTNEILMCGAVPLYNISTESAYAKLLLAYNCNKYGTPEQLINKNIFFEHLL